MFVPIVFIVIRRGNFWRIDYNTETDFSEIFAEILFGNIGYSEIGLISALGRNECARACKNIGNDEFFTTLENALFCFCFDEEVPKTRTDPSLQAKYLLRPNWNRWYNSSLQFVSSGDGFTGCIYDHTVSEGIVIIELFESIFRVVNAEKNKNNCETEVRNNEDLNSKIPEIKMPDTKIHQTKIIETNITTPDKNFQKLTLPTSSLRFKPPRTDVKIRVYKYKLYGKDFIKSQRFSPDAYIQVALQLAYYLTHFQFTATYESCSIRKFNLGRVDNIRACQQPSIDFCKSVLKQESASVKVRNSKHQENLQLLMEKAIHNQTKHTQKVVNGKGLDNHLLGLSSVSESGLFKCCAYKKFSDFKLSTSQIPIAEGSVLEGCFMCYGPVVDDGYGCSYQPNGSDLVFCISSWESSEFSGLDKFKGSIHNSLDVMKDICQS